MKFSIRDLLWLIAFAAILTAWRGGSTIGH